METLRPRQIRNVSRTKSKETVNNNNSSLPHDIHRNQLARIAVQLSHLLKHTNISKRKVSFENLPFFAQANKRESWEHKRSPYRSTCTVFVSFLQHYSEKIISGPPVRPVAIPISRNAGFNIHLAQRASWLKSISHSSVTVQPPPTHWR